MTEATPWTDRSPFNLFGELALQQNFITRGELDEVLRQQAELARDGSLRPLGQILLQKGRITTAQFLKVLQLQKKNLLACGPCQKLYAIAEFRAGEPYACRFCKGPLTPPTNVIDRAIEEYTPPPGMPMAAPIVSGVAIGKYEVLSEIARGGMGIIYLARDPQMNRYVALKVLKQESTTDLQIERLRREAQAAGRLRHPNIVTVHDVGEDAGVHYIVMEYVRGRPLNAVIKEGKLLTRDFLAMLEQIARAVHFAHDHGVVHRDLKPANVLVESSGKPIITDFGLAKLDEPGAALTQSGVAAGTPVYMAPEQVTGRHREVDERTDVYALGVMLYEFLTGRPPFEAENIPRLYAKILEEDPRRPRELNRSIDSELEVICLKAMEKSRYHRYRTAADFADDVRAFLSGEPIRARPTTLARRAWRKVRRHRTVAIASILVAIVIVGAIGWVVAHESARGARQNRARKPFDEAEAALREARELRVVATRKQAAERAEGLFTRALDLDPQFIDALLGRGEARRLAGRFDEALADYRAAIERAPRLAAAVAGYLEARLEQYQEAYRDESIQVVANALSQTTTDLPRPDPAMPRLKTLHDDIVARVRRLAELETLEGKRAYYDALLAFAEERYAEAISGFDRAERSGYASPELYYYAGVSRAHLGGADRFFRDAKVTLDSRLLEEAVEYFHKAAQNGYMSSRLFILLAECRLALVGDTPEVRAAFDQGVAGSDGDPDYLAERALYFLKIRQYEKAAADLQAAIARKPSVPYRQNLALAFVQLRRFEEAVALLDRLIEERPRFVHSYIDRACAHLGLSHLKEAEADARAAIAISDRSATPHEILGRVHLMQGSYSEALKECDRGRQLNPEYRQILMVRSAALLNLGRFKEAVDAGTDFLIQPGSEPSDRLVALETRANALYGLSRFEDALNDWNEVVSAAPRKGEARYGRGLCHYTLRHDAEASSDFEEAIRLGYDTSKVRYAAGVAAARLHDDARALEHLEKAVKADPKNANATGARGDAHYNVGNLKEAIRDWQRAIELDGSLRERLERRIGTARARLDKN